MIAILIDTVIIIAAFALQIGLPTRLTIAAAVVVAACLVVQLTVGRDNDHYFVVFIVMMVVVLALLVRGAIGQVRRRSGARAA